MQLVIQAWVYTVYFTILQPTTPPHPPIVVGEKFSLNEKYSFHYESFNDLIFSFISLDFGINKSLRKKAILTVENFSALRAMTFTLNI